MTRKIAVVGLGYVGLPVAVAFGQKQEVVGFDINEERIAALKKHYDSTNEVTSENLQKANVAYTTDAKELRECDFIIVAIPTPITDDKQPNLAPLISVSETIGANLSKGTIVVYESTVYPGVTEEECIPVLEKYSKLKAGQDFYVGYSPERINPGDKKNTFSTINKIVSGQTEQITEIIYKTYKTVIQAEVFKASSIKVAEAAKVIENTQRDLNIALMNEFAMIFDRLDIDTKEVLTAAKTKWNFLPFSPGLVGGHCISVDPYYLTHKAQQLGYDPHMILAGRRINDGMSHFIVSSLIKKMIKADLPIKNSVVTILGITFKEDVPDVRNSKVMDIISELKRYGIQVQIADSMMEVEGIKMEDKLVPFEELKPSQAVILAVPHQQYISSGWETIEKLVLPNGILMDVKGALNSEEKPANIHYWRL
ncbi:nucleotide sugar dehydrogenase [Listeria booriae]|uniref:Nucleotide sugar dehydrogenase n=1 Tax=Listeria booriae TaxID=1552123 RepID=A0A7X1DJT5_9LIST|nr:nucleotide sugar dehydrogenase [Listeria booriae]MBC1401335.1 nucleotide sugar dehydrogenase [Listeria booriae]MBC1616348.1 nucleotide sugar dehydrogenase [Listeria booriae]MBC2309704.1 nucleotide sugar dehydrogenase [Listeria booriae]MBC2320363.1 nucleotide sugar dehydrogenase [Listeria booriae]